MDKENQTAAPEHKNYAPGKACAEPRSGFAESKSFLSKFLRAVEREKDELPEWEELLLRELIGNSARYGWNAWETEENARRYEEAFDAYLQSLGCPEEVSAVEENNWFLLPETHTDSADIEEFQRMAAFYEPDDVNFWRPGLDNEEIVRDDEIVNKCTEILGDNGSKNDYYGCTYQYGIDEESTDPYVRPNSMTYLSDEWKGEELENVKSHELAHQFIFTLRQLILRENRRRRILGLPNLSPEEEASFIKESNKLSKILDDNEAPEWDFPVEKLYLRRKVDVIRELKKLHCRFLRKLHDLELGR